MSFEMVKEEVTHLISAKLGWDIIQLKPRGSRWKRLPYAFCVLHLPLGGKGIVLKEAALSERKWQMLEVIKEMIKNWHTLSMKVILYLFSYT